nr:hypothetical protein GCM10025732_29120 [Glycomyces mayteni]
MVSPDPSGTSVTGDRSRTRALTTTLTALALRDTPHIPDFEQTRLFCLPKPDLSSVGFVTSLSTVRLTCDDRRTLWDAPRMVLEVAEIKITPGQEDAFKEAYRAAREFVKVSPASAPCG